MSTAKLAVPTLRILFGAAGSLGPGKIALLEAIGRCGSISAAAREMDMSYRRAWLLVEAMNQSFRAPLVLTATGGRRGGGAQITPLAREVLQRYQTIEHKAQAAVASEIQAFQSLLAPQSLPEKK